MCQLALSHSFLSLSCCKASKPAMEKRRRARINESLQELKALVLDGVNKNVRFTVILYLFIYLFIYYYYYFFFFFGGDHHTLWSRVVVLRVLEYMYGALFCFRTLLTHEKVLDYSLVSLKVLDWNSLQPIETRDKYFAICHQFSIG